MPAAVDPAEEERLREEAAVREAVRAIRDGAHAALRGACVAVKTATAKVALYNGANVTWAPGHGGDARDTLLHVVATSPAANAAAPIALAALIALIAPRTAGGAGLAVDARGGASGGTALQAALRCSHARIATALVNAGADLAIAALE